MKKLVLLSSLACSIYLGAQEKANDIVGIKKIEIVETGIFSKEIGKSVIYTKAVKSLITEINRYYEESDSVVNHYLPLSIDSTTFRYIASNASIKTIEYPFLEEKRMIEVHMSYDRKQIYINDKKQISIQGIPVYDRDKFKKKFDEEMKKLSE